MANGKKVQPWERHTSESAEAFEAFVIYRDLGVDRNLIKVWQKLGKSHTVIERWSRRHVGCCAAWSSNGSWTANA